MSEQFESMKKKMVEQNEENFGDEIREKYGEEAYEASNNVIMGLTEEKWLKSEEIRKKAEDALKKAAENGNPESEEALKAAKLHGEWASTFWENGEYSPEAHELLADLYVQDDRFKSYYDAVVSGGAEFLNKAVKNYIKNNYKK